MEELKVFEVKPFVFKTYYKLSHKVVKGSNEVFVMVNDYEATSEFPSFYPIDEIPSSAKRMKVCKGFNTCKERTDMFLDLLIAPQESYSNALR